MENLLIQIFGGAIAAITLGATAYFLKRRFDTVDTQIKENNNLIHKTREEYLPKSEYNEGVKLIRDDIKDLRAEIKELTKSILGKKD